MIRAVIIDDEKNNIDNLCGLLQKHTPEVEVVATATNADDGIARIMETAPDLVLLDIQMPGKNGFEVLKALPHSHFELVFVTAYDQYGIQAVKFAAIDYLLKPVNTHELKGAVAKVKGKLEQRKQNLQLENLLKLIRQKDEKKEHRLALATTKEMRFVNPDKIIRCESSNAYTLFYLAGGEKITVSRPIFEFEELLTDYGFIRCHQSHLVNKSFIKSWIRENGGYLLLDDGTEVPVSRGKKENLVQALIPNKK